MQIYPSSLIEEEELNNYISKKVIIIQVVRSKFIICIRSNTNKHNSLGANFNVSLIFCCKTDRVTRIIIIYSKFQNNSIRYSWYHPANWELVRTVRDYKEIYLRTSNILTCKSSKLKYFHLNKRSSGFYRNVVNWKYFMVYSKVSSRIL